MGERTYPEELREYTERLERYENRQAELQDRWVITTSGAALAITLSFVRELERELDFAWTLWVSWGLLAASVSAALFSIAIGRVSLRKMIDPIRQHPGQFPPQGTAKKSSIATVILNWSALITLACGLAAMVAFGAVNLG